jgi:hypothetical protein
MAYIESFLDGNQRAAYGHATDSLLYLTCSIGPLDTVFRIVRRELRCIEWKFDGG